MPLHTVFSAVLNMSITASIAILVVLLARIVLKRAPKVFSYALWAVVLFRLFCPVSLTSQFSLMGLFPAPTTETGRIEYVSLNMLHAERPAITVDVPASDLSQTADNPAEPPIADVAAAGSLDVLVSMASRPIHLPPPPLPPAGGGRAASGVSAGPAFPWRLPS